MEARAEQVRDDRLGNLLRVFILGAVMLLAVACLIALRQTSAFAAGPLARSSSAASQLAGTAKLATG
ncbi:MAG: hypothetical protein J2P40_08505, partial [Candidatus Dormibacteraeota bacterium]|nr:hypothetical protein [Candidatus Dormibacteraeota bacterium]